MSFLEDLIPVLLSGVSALADGVIDGKDLNPDQKKACFGAMAVIDTYGKKIVEDSENKYDDAALETLYDFAKDTLEEAGVNFETMNYLQILGVLEEPEQDEEPPSE